MLFVYRTRKVDCKAMVRLLLSEDGQSLDVVESDLDHSNHVVSKEVYLHLPMQRRLDQAHKMQAETLLSVCGNVKLVQQHMQNVSGKVCTWSVASWLLHVVWIDWLGGSYRHWQVQMLRYPGLESPGNGIGSGLHSREKSWNCKALVLDIWPSESLCICKMQRIRLFCHFYGTSGNQVALGPPKKPPNPLTRGSALEPQACWLIL